MHNPRNHVVCVIEVLLEDTKLGSVEVFQDERVLRQCELARSANVSSYTRIRMHPSPTTELRDLQCQGTRDWLRHS